MTGPRALRSILDRWHPSGGTSEADPQSLVSVAWPDVVGPDVARRTRSGKLRDGVLTVYTAGSTWSHQLTFLAPNIVAELNVRCPSAHVRQLRFVVAGGRLRALLDGLARSSSVRKHPTRTDVPESVVDASGGSAEDIVTRLRRRQQSLDRRREREGWTRCGECGSWREPVASGHGLCRACADARREQIDRRIEGVLADAPWLRAPEVASHVVDADRRSFERARRHLLTRWEEHLFAARGRLRRDMLHAADRMIAWSYLMMRSGCEQHRIGRAVVVDVLGDQWANVLVGRSTRSDRKATSTPSKNNQKTNARVFSARERTSRGPLGD